MKRSLCTLWSTSMLLIGCPTTNTADTGPQDAAHSEDAAQIDAAQIDAAQIDAANVEDAGLPDSAVRDAHVPLDARPTWDPRLGCLGGWSAPLFCAAGEECTSYPNACTPAPPPGALPTGSICGDRSECASGICEGASGFPSRYCFAACERNADCASGSTCVLSFDDPSGANLRRCTPLAGDCARCTEPADYCDEEAFSAEGRGDCLAACRTTSDCTVGDCRIRNGSSLTPFCEVTTSDCASDEIRVDTDSGRRQACVKLRPCFDMSECDPELSCVEVAYGGLRAPVRFCGRVL